MRQIAVSAEIFAKIWALREAGEDTENDILARLLAQGPSQKLESYNEKTAQGFRDVRHGVHFAEGFEIFRTLKGEDVRAWARSGKWVLKGSGTLYGSINELSSGIGAGTENAWASWFFLGPDGRRQQISTLRDPTAVARRSKAKPPAPLSEDALWLADVRAGLAAIEDGRGLLDDIYKAVENLRGAAGRDWPASAKATILRTLAENASDSEAYKGGADLFSQPYGKSAGFWALR